MRIFILYAFLIFANLAAWALALMAFHEQPLLLGTALLAYTFGLRHAVDADHIAAIDNVTRKLMQQGKEPIAVGLFFSLGHSTIVFALSIGIALTATFIPVHFKIGTALSALFLLLIGIANIFILAAVYQIFQRVRRGARYAEEDLDLLMANRGFFGRLFKNLFGWIDRSWQMYPIGFLFGLGFDTATEVGLLGISAMEATAGLSVWSILVFPTLFTAGMALVDSTDSVLMVRAYGWAFKKPIRKLYYNMTITSISILMALLIGTIQLLGLIGGNGPFWSAIEALNNNMGLVGILMIGTFFVSWAVSILIYHMSRYDQIDL